MRRRSTILTAHLHRCLEMRGLARMLVFCLPGRYVGPPTYRRGRTIVWSRHRRGHLGRHFGYHNFPHSRQPKTTCGVSIVAISTVVARSLLVAGGVCFASKLILSAYFMGHRPTKPEIELGLTFAFNQHGGVVYLTHYESILLSVLFWAAAFLMGAGASIIISSRASNTDSRT